MLGISEDLVYTRSRKKFLETVHKQSLHLACFDSHMLCCYQQQPATVFAALSVRMDSEIKCKAFYEQFLCTGNSGGFSEPWTVRPMQESPEG